MLGIQIIQSLYKERRILAKEKKPPLPKGRGTTEGGGDKRPLPKGERATKWRGDSFWKENTTQN